MELCLDHFESVFSWEFKKGNELVFMLMSD